jgi:hypothetical protein
VIGIAFPGTKEDAEVLAAVREARAISDVAEEFDLPDEEVVSLYQDYLRHRGIVMTGPDAEQVHQGYLDHLDALVHRYAAPAQQGDVQAAKFVLAAISALASLEERFARARAMRQALASNVSDGDKGHALSQDRTITNYLRLKEICDKWGDPIPPEIERAYRQLITGRAH